MLRYCILINRTTLVHILTSDDFDTLEGPASFTVEESTFSRPQSLNPNPPQGEAGGGGGWRQVGGSGFTYTKGVPLLSQMGYK